MSARRPAPLLRTIVVVMALWALVACGSTVQQTAAGPGAAPAGDELAVEGDGLELPVAPTPGVPAAGEPLAPGGEVVDPAAPAGPPAPGAPPGGAPGPDAAPGPKAPAAAAPAAVDRRPLRIGLAYVNNDAASGAGVDNGNTFGPRRLLEALVASANERGGLAGRKLEPTYAEIRSSSSNYASDLQAACARLVQDAKVSVVLSFLGITDEQFSSCLSKAGVPHVNGSYGLGDRTSMAGQPTTVSTQALSVDRRSVALLENLSRTGHLTKASRLGVIVEGCPYNERAAERTLLPTAKKLGLNVVRTQTTRCFGGINDLSGLASDASNAVLQFSSNRVDRVLVVSSVESNVLLVFTQAAESQGYRPGYALTSLALANVLKDNVPQQQLTQAKGVGWLPAMDDTQPSFTTTPQTQGCVKAVTAQGVRPASRLDHFLSFSQCDAFGLVEQVLRATRGSTAPAQFSAGLDAVGTGLRGAATVQGRTDFSRGRRDGPALGRVFTWTPTCSCFTYAGGSFGL